MLGVLEVLDKRGDAAFDLHDVELATVFARQATVAIRATRIERDTASLLRSVLATLSGEADGERVSVDDDGQDATIDVEAIVRDAVADLDSGDDGALWALADEIARLRTLDPVPIHLLRELLAVLVRPRQPHHGATPAHT